MMVGVGELGPESEPRVSLILGLTHAELAMLYAGKPVQQSLKDGHVARIAIIAGATREEITGNLRAAAEAQGSSVVLDALRDAVDIDREGNQL